MAYHSVVTTRLRSARGLKAGLVVLGASMLLAGCARVSPDGGMAFVSSVADADLRKEVVKLDDATVAEHARLRVKKLLARPLSPGAAVQIALLNNRSLQAAFNDLGISEAQMVQASLPPDPTFSIARVSGSLTLEIERQILVNLLALATLPKRQEIAREKFKQAQLRAVQETLKLAADTRRAWYQAVGSRHKMSFLASANVNARTVSRLFKKLGESGAVNKMDQAREHVFYAELAGQLAMARTQHQADREKLTRLMGLWSRKIRFKLPRRLPSLPRRTIRKPFIEREAVKRNIAIAMAQAEVDTAIRTFGLTNATRFVNVLELRGMSIFDRDKSVGPGGGVEKDIKRKKGIELEIRVPIFDFGQARQREAEETYKRTVNRLIARAIDVRSIARESYLRYRGSYDLAAHYRRQVLPLRKIIADESLLRYNAMLIDVFPLLAEARQRIASNITYITAQKDFWLAHADLHAAIIGGGSAGGASGSEGPAMAAASGGGGH
ncbi:MAG: TolC family protein [Hyphomicrobiales bacterium]|nr:TolC family protein [Hyphomicrobiales bacterium]